MISKYVYTLIIIIALCSCKKKEKLNSFLIIEGENAKVTYIGDTLKGCSCNEGIPYSLDCDSDGVFDFKFISYCCSSPAHFYQYTRFECLHYKAMIVDNNSELTPDILNAGYVLNADNHWDNTESELLRISYTSAVIGGSGDYYIDGVWHNVTNKYIGFKIAKEDYLYYGWIKLSVPDENYISICLNEVGIVKAAYP